METIKKPEYIFYSGEGKLIVTDGNFEEFWKTKRDKLSLETQDKNPYNELGYLLKKYPYNFFNCKEYFPCQPHVLLLGIPYKQGSISPNTTVDKFPKHLRELSCKYPIYSQIEGNGTSGLFDIGQGKKLFRGLKIKDLGDLLLPLESLNHLYEVIFTIVKNLPDQSVLISIGGDHSITYAILKTFIEQFGKDIILVILDAHHDSGYRVIPLEDINNSNFVFHLLKCDKVEKILQIGTRGLRSVFQLKEDPKVFRFPDFSTDQIFNKLDNIKKENPKACFYLSIDLDCINPIEFPFVDSPVSGGPMGMELLNFLDRLFCLKIPFCGIDLVEGSVRKGIEKNDLPIKILAYCLDGLKRLFL